MGPNPRNSISPRHDSQNRRCARSSLSVFVWFKINEMRIDECVLLRLGGNVSESGLSEEEALCDADSQA